MKSKFNIIITVFVFCLSASYAQDDTLQTNEVYIYQEYEPTVSDAFKMSSFPVIKSKSIEAPDIKYSIINKQVKTSFSVEPIKPAKMKGDRLGKLSKSYLKAGVGNYTNNMVEIYVNNSRSRKHNVGVFAKHLGSNGGIDGVGYNGFSSQAVSVYGKKFLRQHLIKGELNYDRDFFRYYGYEVDTTNISEFDTRSFLNKDNTRQFVSVVSANAGLKSFFKDSAKVDYDLALNFDNLTDRFGVMENYFLLEGVFVKCFNSSFSDFANSEKVRLDASIDFNNYSWSDTAFYAIAEAGNQNNALVKLSPSIASSGDFWKLDVGMNLNVNVSENASFHFYPNVHFKYNVLKDMLIPYAGVNGGVSRNNYNSFITTNSFILSSVSLKNTNKRFDIYGGVRGALSSKIAFNLRASVQEFRNMPLFVNHDTLGLTFDVIYDTVQVSRFGGEISYHNSQRLNIIFNGEFRQYKMKSEKAPWHLPNLNIGITGVYDLRDKIIVRGDLQYNSKQQARSFDANDYDLGGDIFMRELNGYVDASVGLEYRYTSKLSVFLNVNNVTGLNYYRWNNYPSQGLNILGGITYSFLD